ncbi:dipeptidase [Aliiroseovarius sp. YM-037]|uniref:dipeptidase n=1 Tax=Aliiroseovarius sp. YM-037 TaxID=3341728 RepID=UPI003A8081DA
MRAFGKFLGRFLFVSGIALIAFLWFAPGYLENQLNPVADHAPYEISEATQALHDDLVIGDWHADSLLWNRDLLDRGSRGQVDIPRLREGNVAVQVFTAVTKSPAGLNYEQNATEAPDNITRLSIAQLWPPRTWDSLLERALYQAERLHDYERRAPDQIKIIRNATDLEDVLTRRAAGEDILGAILGIEGGHPLEGDLANLDKLTDAGYRLVGLQHFFDNELGGSLHGTGNRGLTDFGRSVVDAVIERGLILDVAHSSPQVARDVLAMTDIPIVVSHTGLHSHCRVKRNFTDDLMKDIAATGGVIGIGYWRDVTCDETPAGIATAIKAAIAVVGEDHVSLGSDFDGSVRTAFDTSELAALTQALLDAGLPESQIRKVMGENMLRVLRARLDP